VTRLAAEDIELGGGNLKAGTLIVICDFRRAPAQEALARC
jgi:hypothetical protein